MRRYRPQSYIMIAVVGGVLITYGVLAVCVIIVLRGW